MKEKGVFIIFDSSEEKLDYFREQAIKDEDDTAYLRALADECIPAIVQPQNFLSDWKWVMYPDGSGHLESPKGEGYFSYDKAPYANVGWVEYQAEKGMGWSVFEESFSEFQKYAEEYVLRNVLKEVENDTIERE